MNLLVDNNTAWNNLTTDRFRLCPDGWPDSGNGTDNYGFNALPGGIRYESGSYDMVGSNGYWWTSSPHTIYIMINLISIRSRTYSLCFLTPKFHISV
jgi:uncharacterized protein (TIGR02145 family)